MYGFQDVVIIRGSGVKQASSISMGEVLLAKVTNELVVLLTIDISINP